HCRRRRGTRCLLDADHGRARLDQSAASSCDRGKCLGRAGRPGARPRRPLRQPRSLGRAVARPALSAADWPPPPRCPHPRRAVAELEEPGDANPTAANARKRADELAAEGAVKEQAWRQATSRVFGSKPGAYGAGLQVLVDEGGWSNRADIADVYLAWSAYAYGGGQDGAKAAGDFAQRIAAT